MILTWRENLEASTNVPHLRELQVVGANKPGRDLATKVVIVHRPVWGTNFKLLQNDSSSKHTNKQSNMNKFWEAV